MLKRSSLAALIAISLASAALVPAAHAAPKYPNRIISLSPSATEILFGIGAGRQVVAVDQNSNYPTTAPVTKLDGFTPNVEAIAKYKPDLVILQSTSTKVTQVVVQLKKLGISTITEITPNNLTDLYAEIQADGKATGRVSSAQTLIASMRKKIAAIIASTPKQKPLKFYHELDNTNYSATSKTFIGQVYSSFGLVNIADGANGADMTGYPQLTPEYIIQSNPSLIFLADAQYGETAVTFASRAGFSTLAATKGSGVVELPADIASRWGPRIVDFYQIVANAMRKVA